MSKSMFLRILWPVLFFFTVLCGAFFQWSRMETKEMMFKAANNEDCKFIKKYIDRGESVNIVDGHGESLLFIAVSNQRYSVVRFLIDNNVDKEVKCRGVKALEKANIQYAAENDNYKKKEIKKIIDLLK